MRYTITKGDPMKISFKLASIFILLSTMLSVISTTPILTAAQAADAQVIN